MERSPVITWLFHLRIGTLLGLLLAINLTMMHYAYSTTTTKGPSVQLVFGFEYAILLTVVFNIAVKYILHTIDLQSENPWDNKPVFLLYTELIIGLLKVIGGRILHISLLVVMSISMIKMYVFSPLGHSVRRFCNTDDKDIYIASVCTASNVLCNERLQESFPRHHNVSKGYQKHEYVVS